MSYSNQAQLEDEWLNQGIEVRITRADGQYLFRKYNLKDGQVPTAAQDGLQEMVDELLDTSEISNE